MISASGSSQACRARLNAGSRAPAGELGLSLLDGPAGDALSEQRAVVHDLLRPLVARFERDKQAGLVGLVDREGVDGTSSASASAILSSRESDSCSESTSWKTSANGGRSRRMDRQVNSGGGRAGPKHLRTLPARPLAKNSQGRSSPPNEGFRTRIQPVSRPPPLPEKGDMPPSADARGLRDDLTPKECTCRSTGDRLLPTIPAERAHRQRAVKIVEQDFKGKLQFCGREDGAQLGGRSSTSRAWRRSPRKCGRKRSAGLRRARSCSAKTSSRRPGPQPARLCAFDVRGSPHPSVEGESGGELRFGLVLRLAATSSSATRRRANASSGADPISAKRPAAF